MESKHSIIKGLHCIYFLINQFYYIPINDTSFELSVFWPSDTEIRFNELRFSESISLSFKTRLKLVTCFCGNVTYSKFQAWNQRRKKHDDIMSRNDT